MHAHRFDTVAKTLGARLSRRSALRRGGGAAVAAAVVSIGFRPAAAQDATPAPVATPAGDGDRPGADSLFVQLAAGGSWLPKPGEDGVYLLTLTGVSAQTIRFTDRPDRVVDTAPTPDLLSALGFTAENPPNAAVVVQTDQGEQVLVVELFNPVYDEAAGSLTYDARLLENYQEQGLQFVASGQDPAAMPESFGSASLFIDDCPDGPVPCRVGGRQVGHLTAGMCYTPIRCQICSNDVPYWSGQCNAAFSACNGQCQADLSYSCSLSCM